LERGLALQTFCSRCSAQRGGQTAALDQEADELDEVLKSIAPEVTDAWQLAIEHVLRRLPHGLS
jgi:hypothetical protein